MNEYCERRERSLLLLQQKLSWGDVQISALCPPMLDDWHMQKMATSPRPAIIPPLLLKRGFVAKQMKRDLLTTFPLFSKNVPFAFAPRSTVN